MSEWQDILKNLDQWLTSFKADWDNAVKQLEEKTDTVITTKFTDKDGTQVSYITTIQALTWSTETICPPGHPTDDKELYWKYHEDLVKEALGDKKELTEKVVETIGSAVGGAINPSGGSSTPKPTS